MARVPRGRRPCESAVFRCGAASASSARNAAPKALRKAPERKIGRARSEPARFVGAADYFAPSPLAALPAGRVPASDAELLEAISPAANAVVDARGSAHHE